MFGSSLLAAAMVTTVHEIKHLGDWLLLAEGRMFIGMIIAALMARRMGINYLQRPEPWGWTRITSSTLGIPAAFYAFTVLPPADAVTLTQTGALWAVLFQAALNWRPPPLSSALAIVIAACGVLVMKRPGFEYLGLGAFVALFNGLARGVGVVASGRLVHTPATTLIFQVSLSASILSGVIFLLSTPDLGKVQLSIPFVAGVVLVAALATGNNIMTTRALKIGSAHKVVPLLYLSPAFAVLAEVTLLGIETTPRHIVGIAMVVLPGLYITRGQKRVLLEVNAELNRIAHIKRDDFVAQAQRFVEQVQRSAMVEACVHAARQDQSLIEQARHHFSELGLNDASQDHGLLVMVYPSTQRVVFIGGQFLEKRLSSGRLSRIVTRSESLEALFDDLLTYLTRALNTGRVMTPVTREGAVGFKA